MKKLTLAFTFVLFTVIILVFPYNEQQGIANQSTFKLAVLDTDSSERQEDVLSKLSKARGKKVGDDFQLSFTPNVTEDTIKKSSAIAYEATLLQSKDSEERKQSLRSAINNQKVIYIYGGVSEKEANTILNQELFSILTDEELTQELVQKGLDNESISKEIEKYHDKFNVKHDVIGAYKIDGKIKPFIAKINSDETITLPEYIDSILDHANSEFLPRNSFLNPNTVQATDVSSVLDLNVVSYVSGVKVAQINMDYILKKTADSDPNYDHFAIKDHMEFTTYNGASPWLMEIYHDLPYAYSGFSDEIESWSPASTTNASNFSVSLPWGISWSFSTNDDVDVTTSGDQTNDNVSWSVDEARLLSSYLYNPERFTPGNAWLSTGTLARISLDNTAYYDYNGVTRSMNYNYDYVYNYD